MSRLFAGITVLLISGQRGLSALLPDGRRVSGFVLSDGVFSPRWN